MAINVHVLKENTLNIPRGLYLGWMGNALSDANANTLIAEGAAILSNIPIAPTDVGFATDANGNPTGLAVPSGIYRERSTKLLSALRPLKAALPLNMLVVSDSTGNGPDEWAYLLADYLADKYPTHTITYKLWDTITERYAAPTSISVGSAGLAYISTGSVASAWRVNVPDSVATSTLGDLDVRVKLNLNGSYYSASTALCGKFGAAGNRSWRIEMNSNGTLFFDMTADGTALINARTSSASIPLSSDPIWVRMALDVDNGATGNTATWYTSIDDAATWVQLGTVSTIAGVTSFFDSTATTQFIGRSDGSMGQQNAAKRFYAMQVYGSLDGSNKVVDIDVGAIPKTTVASSITFIDDVGNLCTCTMPSGSSLQGSPRLGFFNSAAPGQDIVYHSDVTRYPKISAMVPAITFVSHSHNATANISYAASYTGLTDKLLATNADMHIVTMSQNSRLAVGNYVYEHALRCQQIATLAAAKGFDFIDVFSNWDAGLYTDAGDGVHPNTAGKALWASLVQRHMAV